MFSFRPKPGNAATIGEDVFREVMNRPTVSRELFLPLDRAWWDGGRFTLGKWRSRTARPALRGVRLQVPRPAREGPPPERDTQSDLQALIRSVSEMRGVPALAGVVLSEETLVGTQNGTVPGKRVMFGLSCPPGGRFDSEPKAAAECHRVLRVALDRAGFAIEHPRAPFDPSSGLTGLRDWAANMRLRRKRSKRMVLLALLLLPFLLLFVPLEWFIPIFVPGAAKAGPVPGGVDKAAIGKAPPGGGDELTQLLKQLESASGMPPGTAAHAAADGMVATGYRLLQIGTVLYFVSGAWLIWVAEAGVLSVIGLLVVPGYPLVLARSNWAKTWFPMLLHVVSIFMIIGGIYYIFLPYFRLINSLTI